MRRREQVPATVLVPEERGRPRFFSGPASSPSSPERGQSTVIKAGRDWDVLSSSDFGEDAHATPAIVDGRIYLRTAGHLYCFGLR